MSAPSFRINGFRVTIGLILLANAVALVYALLHWRGFVQADIRAESAFSTLFGEASPSKIPQTRSLLLILDFTGVLFASFTAALVGWKGATVPASRLFSVFLCSFALMVGPVWTFAFTKHIQIVTIAAMWCGSAWLSAAAFLRFSYLFPHQLQPAEITARSVARNRTIARFVSEMTVRSRTWRWGSNTLAWFRAHTSVPGLSQKRDAISLLILCIALVVSFAGLAFLVVLVTLANTPADSDLLGWGLFALVTLQKVLAAGVGLMVLSARFRAVAISTRATRFRVRSWLPPSVLLTVAAALILAIAPLGLSTILGLVGLSLVAASRLDDANPARIRDFDHSMALLLVMLLGPGLTPIGMVSSMVLCVALRHRIAQALRSRSMRYRVDHPLRWVRLALRHGAIIWAFAAAAFLTSIPILLAKPHSVYTSVYMLLLLVAVFGCICIGVRNLRLGYALTDNTDSRRKVMWLVNGCVVALAVLILQIISATFPGALPGPISIFVDGYGPNILLPIVSITSFMAIFYRGAIDPELLLNRTSFYGVAGITTVVVFAVVEDILKEFLAVFLALPKPAVPLVAGGSAALSLLPIHHRIGPWIEAALLTLFPKPVGALTSGTAVLLIGDIDSPARDIGDDRAAADIALSLKSIAKESAWRHKGTVVGNSQNRILLAFPPAEPAFEAARDLKYDFSRTLQRQHLPQTELRVAMHAGSVFRSASGDVYGKAVSELEELCQSATPGRVLVSAAAIAAVSGSMVFVGDEFAIYSDDAREEHPAE